jgi:NTE family protein
VARRGVAPTRVEREPHAVKWPAQGQRWALVLSSGGKRGFAHAGALAALERNGLKPDIVVGASAGALVGAMYASGMTAREVAAADVGDVFDPVFSVFRRRVGKSASIEAFIRKHLRETHLEKFPIPFAAVATRLEDGCLAVFNAGDAARAVFASMSVPGFFMPAAIEGSRYGDGGLVSPLPIGTARLLGATTVIAIDVSYHPGWEPPEGIVESMFYGPLLAVRNLAVLEAQHADLVIRPELPPIAEIERGEYEAVADAGATATLKAVPKIRELLKNPPPPREMPPDPRYCAGSPFAR